MEPDELDALLYADDEAGPRPWDPGMDPHMDPDPAPMPPDAGVAAWHMRKAHRARARAAAASALFDAEISRLQARLADVQRPLEREAVWHERAVEAWHRQNVRDVGKTVKFPAGTSKLTAGRGKWEVTDADALRAALAERGQEAQVFVPQGDRFMVSALQRLAQVPKVIGGREPRELARPVFTDTGEVVPGVVTVATPATWKAGD